MAVSESEMAAQPPSSLSAQIEQDSIFFDQLVDMVPPGIYFPSNQNGASWKYLPSKALRLAAREETKERTKQSKRRKLDPSANRSSLTIQRQQQASNPDLAPPPNPHPSSTRAASYEQLRERLHQRLAQLRSQNTAAPQPEGPRIRQQRPLNPKPRLRPAEPEVPLSLEFGRMSSATGADLKPKSGLKARRPKTGQLLAKAAALQDKLAAVQREEGEEGIAPYVWGKAGERAAGNKVLDDPKLLKQTMKRQKKKTQKSAQQWKNRVDAESASRAAKQNKRQDALKHRADKKLKTKIARREKKLVRPGFEGRARGGATLGSKPAAS